MGMPGAGYMIATDKSYVGDLVRLAGGQNVYAANGQTYISPNNESLATKKPDVILRLEHALPNVTKPQFEKRILHQPGLEDDAGGQKQAGLRPPATDL